jgi:anthranilate/para-aminobenzoate synthase component I
MTTLKQACDFFDSSRNAEKSARYLLHLPRQDKAYLGLGCHKVIRYQRDGFHIQTEGESIHLPAVREPLAAMRDLLDADYPSFWMISADLCRSVDDPELPLLLCIQPQYEVLVSGFETSIGIQQRSSAELPQGWQTQSDELFLGRLTKGIEILRNYPHGKMILTRPYQREIGAQDPLRLFSILAGSEPASACNHFLQIDHGVYSLGCSPENVFEVADGRLIFDVVAGTRGVSPDTAVDAKWLSALQTNTKERREHLMAFDRYKARIETLINPGSLKVEHQLQVLQMASVRHLYSRLSGRIKSELDWLTLLADSFPALTSYPEALKPLSEDPGEPLRFYGGVFGRVAPFGKQAAFFLNLRAALAKKHLLFTQGGVGVIAESEPAKELLEVKNKLRGLMQAVAEWEQEL